jgi:hypothetical protein
MQPTKWLEDGQNKYFYYKHMIHQIYENSQGFVKNQDGLLYSIKDVIIIDNSEGRQVLINDQDDGFHTLIVKCVKGKHFWYEYYLGVNKSSMFWSDIDISAQDRRCRLLSTVFGKKYINFDKMKHVYPLDVSWISFSQPGQCSDKLEYPFLNNDIMYYGGAMEVHKNYPNFNHIDSFKAALTQLELMKQKILKLKENNDLTRINQIDKKI